MKGLSSGKPMADLFFLQTCVFLPSLLKPSHSNFFVSSCCFWSSSYLADVEFLGRRGCQSSSLGLGSEKSAINFTCYSCLQAPGQLRNTYLSAYPVRRRPQGIILLGDFTIVNYSFQFLHYTFMYISLQAS